MKQKYWDKHLALATNILSRLEALGKPHDVGYCPVEVETSYRALANCMTRPWDWKMVQWAVGQHILAQQKGIDSLGSTMDEMLARHLRSSGLQRNYRMVLPLDVKSIDLGSVPFRISLNKMDIEIRPFVSVAESMGHWMAAQHIEILEEEKRFQPAYYAVTQFEAASAHHAIGKFADAFNLWRSAINFVSWKANCPWKSAPRYRARLSSISLGRCIGDTGEVMAFHVAGSANEEDVNKHAILSTESIRRAGELLAANGGNVPQESSKDLLLNGIAAFGFALDQHEMHIALLVLWQLAERLTLVNANEKHTLICERLAQMSVSDTKESYEERKQALSGIMSVRNEITHRGSFGEVTDADVYFLERTCVDALDWLTAHKERYPTKRHLRFYFEYSKSATSHRRALAETLRALDGEEFRDDAGSAAMT